MGVCSSRVSCTHICISGSGQFIVYLCEGSAVVTGPIANYRATRVFLFDGQQCYPQQTIKLHPEGNVIRVSSIGAARIIVRTDLSFRVIVTASSESFVDMVSLDGASVSHDTRVVLGPQR